MENVEIKFKKTHNDAILPTKNMDAAGWDVYSVEDKIIPAGGSAVVDNGLQLAHITPGYWFQINTRSGMGFKYGLRNHAGIVDSDYRGNLGICIFNHSEKDYHVQKGDRIAQLIIFKNYQSDVSWGEVTETERGSDGFGSSGK